MDLTARAKVNSVRNILIFGMHCKADNDSIPAQILSDEALAKACHEKLKLPLNHFYTVRHQIMSFLHVWDAIIDEKLRYDAEGWNGEHRDFQKSFLLCTQLISDRVRVGCLRPFESIAGIKPSYFEDETKNGEYLVEEHPPATTHTGSYTAGTPGVFHSGRETESSEDLSENEEPEYIALTDDEEPSANDEDPEYLALTDDEEPSANDEDPEYLALTDDEEDDVTPGKEMSISCSEDDTDSEGWEHPTSAYQLPSEQKWEELRMRWELEEEEYLPTLVGGMASNHGVGGALDQIRPEKKRTLADAQSEGGMGKLWDTGISKRACLRRSGADDFESSNFPLDY